MPAPGEMARFAGEARAAIFGGGATLPQGLTARDPAQVARRFAVYRNNVTVGLGEALATRFPVVRRLVGDAFFEGAARVFLAQHPPRSPVMTFYGDAFPDFLAGFPPAAGLPYLPDVARLEAARTHAYHAADSRPLAAGDLAAVAEHDPAVWRVALHPALRIIASAHPVVAIWAMNQPGATPGPLASPEPQTAFVSRPHLDVRVVPAEPGEAAFLAASGRGASFAAAVEAALATGAAFDPARALARVLAHGLCAGVTLLETETEEPS